MNQKLAWYIARSSGIVAWALLAAAVVWGLLLSTRILNRRPTPRWLLDLHRFLGGFAVLFTAVHLTGLVADNYVHFGLTDLLVPLVSHWKTGPVALGVVGFWLLLAVEGTSLAMRHIPRSRWRAVHLTSYGLFWIATLHGLLAGTDAHNRVYVLATQAVAVLVAGLTVLRVVMSVSGSGRSGTTRDDRSTTGVR